MVATQARTSGIALVTGGGSGIGAAVSLALAEIGWIVIIAGRRYEALEAQAAAHPDLALQPRTADVTSEESVRSLVDGIVAEHGRLDLVFNNAGASGSAREIDEVPLAEWQAVVDVNLTGTFLCTREAFRVMRTQDPQGGRIINNGSISAHAPRPNSIAYAATKHAVTGMTKATALDGRRFSIACGQIDIGNAATDMTSAMTGGVPQADGTSRPEPTMDVTDVARAVVYMAGLPLGANVANLTVLATAMPFVGRG